MSHLSYVHVLRKTLHQIVNVVFMQWTSNKCTKKRDVHPVVLVIKPIVFDVVVVVVVVVA